MDTIIIDEAADIDPSQFDRIKQLIEAEKAVQREAVMVLGYTPYPGAQAEFFEIDGKHIEPGTPVVVSYGCGDRRNGTYFVAAINETPKCTIVESDDDPKLRALYAQLSRAKMQRNKHLVTDLEKRIKSYVRH